MGARPLTPNPGGSARLIRSTEVVGSNARRITLREKLVSPRWVLDPSRRTAAAQRVSFAARALRLSPRTLAGSTPVRKKLDPTPVVDPHPATGEHSSLIPSGRPLTPNSGGSARLVRSASAEVVGSNARRIHAFAGKTSSPRWWSTPHAEPRRLSACRAQALETTSWQPPRQASPRSASPSPASRQTELAAPFPPAHSAATAFAPGGTAR
jgi:hypothetical protein